MIANLPLWIELMFILTALMAIIIFHFSNGRRKVLTIIILLWSIIQCIIAYSGFYHDTTSMPPKIALAIGPPLILILYGLFSGQRDAFIKTRITTLSTFLHTIRISIEFILLQLFLVKMIPELMTFEGRNYDIIIGITAPIIGLLNLNKKLSKHMLLGWNVIGLILVCFIFVNAILSAEVPFQLFAFEQPNRALIYAPFILLPSVVVPLVIFTHVIDILKLRKETTEL